jgi:hypothetical protein
MDLGDKRRLPALNTQTIDMEDYKELRRHFMAEYVKFRRGNASAAEVALNDLFMMYQILPAARHANKDKADSVKFLSEIDTLQDRVDAHIKDGEHTSLKENVREFDTLFMRFEAIMYELNYTR